jgi:hypothetical protein
LKLDEERAGYIRDYERHEGVALRADAVENNPALRSVVKLCLNSFWGKLCQQANKRQVSVVYELAEFWSIMMNPLLEVCSIQAYPHPRRRAAEMQYERRVCYAEEAATTNVYYGAFTTTYARMRLHEVLSIVGERALYVDTDSVVYVDDGSVDFGELEGPYLGQLKDELGGRRWIAEFVSTGPKSYAYRDSSGGVVMKCKGIRHTLRNASVVDFETMLACIDDGCVLDNAPVAPLPPPIQLPYIDDESDDEGIGCTPPPSPVHREWPSSPVARPHPRSDDDDDDDDVVMTREFEAPADPNPARPMNMVFRLDRWGRIQTDYQCKVFRMVYSKRWIGREYKTYPFGY